MPTPQQVIEMQIKIGRQLVWTNKLLQITIDGQHRTGKVLAERLPGMSEEQRQALKASISVVETDMEQWQMVEKQFAESVETFANLK